MVKNEKEEGNMTRSMPLTGGKLPYPTRPLQVQGGTVEEYIIPDETKGEILEILYPFRPNPRWTKNFMTYTKRRGSESGIFASPGRADITSWSARTTLEVAAA
jgi:hypothetical protein